MTYGAYCQSRGLSILRTRLPSKVRHFRPSPSLEILSILRTRLRSKVRHFRPSPSLEISRLTGQDHAGMQPTGLAKEQLRALGRLSHALDPGAHYLAGGSAIAVHLGDWCQTALRPSWSLAWRSRRRAKRGNVTCEGGPLGPSSAFRAESAGEAPRGAQRRSAPVT